MKNLQNYNSIIQCSWCTGCQVFGQCDDVAMPLFDDQMLNDPALQALIRKVALDKAIPDALWTAELFIMNGLLPVKLKTSRNGAPHLIDGFDLEPLFLPSDEVIAEGRAEQFVNTQRHWYKKVLNTAPIEGEVITFSAARREHARMIFTILAAHYPQETIITWLDSKD